MSCYPHKIASNLLLSKGEFIKNPLVEVDASGRILSVESYTTLDGIAHTEFYSGVMCAGFVNAHCHLELSYLHSLIEPKLGFAHFARSIGELRTKSTLGQRLRAIEIADIKMRSEGIAGVGDIVNGDTTLECKAKSPIKYHNFGELFGLNTTSCDSLSWIHELPHSSLTPHSIYSLNDQLFRDICTQNPQAPLSIHFMESTSELELYSKQGALWRWYEAVGFECDFLHYGSPARRIIESIPKDRSVMLIHNCCVREEDIDLILGHFTAPVYWVLCPRSNDYISSLTPPTELLRRKGANICIGTDSLASNHSLSILEEIRALGDTMPLGEALDAATRVGAHALGFEELGEIEVGRRPGINILSGVDYKSMRLTANSTITPVVSS
ncbi:MAG: amidohydrolase family protein [Rikenellaceae bacterium]